MKNMYSLLLVIFSFGFFQSCDDEKDSWKEPPAVPEKIDVLEKIKDPVFKSRILQNMDIYDTDNNGKLSEEEAAAVTSLFLNGANNIIKDKINSLEGIEYFIGVKSLDCANNELTSLELSKNLNLDYLACSYNELTTLNIKKNNALSYIYCNNNKLNELDINNKKQLKYLMCSNNQIESLDLQNCAALEELYCYKNQLNNLILGEHKMLTKLYCYDNKLKILDTGNCESVRELLLANNLLEELDISKFDYMKLKWLDAEYNPALTRLWVSKSFHKSMLTDYNVHVPADIKVTVKYYLSDEKDIIKTMLGNMKKYFEEAILNKLAKYDTDEYTGALSTVEAAQIPTLNIANRIIYRLYNIEYFTGLKEFDFSDNKIKTVVSLSNNPKLEVINCSNNNIPEIDFSECKQLQRLSCNVNNLTALDLSQNTELVFLSCEQNELTELDISCNKKLLVLYSTKNPQLKTIYVWKGFNRKQLTHFEIEEGIEIIEKGE